MKHNYTLSFTVAENRLIFQEKTPEKNGGNGQGAEPSSSDLEQAKNEYLNELSKEAKLSEVEKKNLSDQAENIVTELNNELKKIESETAEKRQEVKNQARAKLQELREKIEIYNIDILMERIKESGAPGYVYIERAFETGNPKLDEYLSDDAILVLEFLHDNKTEAQFKEALEDLGAKGGDKKLQEAIKRVLMPTKEAVSGITATDWGVTSLEGVISVEGRYRINKIAQGGLSNLPKWVLDYSKTVQNRMEGGYMKPENTFDHLLEVGVYSTMFTLGSATAAANALMSKEKFAENPYFWAGSATAATGGLALYHGGVRKALNSMSENHEQKLFGDMEQMQKEKPKLYTFLFKNFAEIGLLKDLQANKEKYSNFHKEYIKGEKHPEGITNTTLETEFEYTAEERAKSKIPENQDGLMRRELFRYILDNFNIKDATNIDIMKKYLSSKTPATLGTFNDPDKKG